MFVQVLYKRSVHTSQRTHPMYIIKTGPSVLFRVIISVYSDNCAAYVNTLWQQTAEFYNVAFGGTYNPHWDSEVWETLRGCGVAQ
jgi:hypothetical protein